MNCPSCGFDKILPMYKFCPKCKAALNKSENKEAESQFTKAAEQPNTKIIGMLLMSYKKAISDPAGFGDFCKKNPNDGKRLWEKWGAEGRDLSILENYSPYFAPTSTNDDIKVNTIQQHNSAVEGAQLAAATAAHTPQVAKSDVIAVGSRNKEHNYVKWAIAKGQIARNISSQAFQELGSVDGVIIEEGVTAVIFIDGELATELQSGLYKFTNENIQREAAEKEEDERSKEGFVRKIGRAGRSLWALITGNRENYNKEEAKKRRERVNRIAQKLSGNSIVSVVLKRDSSINITMGIHPVANEDGTSRMEFAPFKIRTKTLTVDVAVALEVRISDFQDFRTTYLMDQMSYSVHDVRLALNSWMRTSIQRELQNYEPDGQLLPTELMSAISYNIILQSRQLLHGIEVSQVLDITTESKELDRFRALEEKLYLTEKEIDYFVRTNEFKNRLQVEENAQKIKEARTDFDYRKEIDAINNDQLVHDDEMESFVQLLQSQKRIREARTENEELAVLLELKGNRLVSEDDFDALESSIRNKKFDRDQVSEAFQLASANRTANTRLQLDTQLTKSQILADAELEDVRFEALRKKTLQGFSLDDIAEEHRREQEIKEATHGDQMLDSELSKQKRVDDYYDARRDRDYTFEQKKEQDEIDLEKQREQNKIDILRQKAEIARQNMQMMQQHEAEMEEKKHQEEMARIEASKTMSADQLMAAGISGMDAEAQKAFAESFANKNASDIQKDMYERIIQVQQQQAKDSAEQMQKFMEFAQSGMQTNAQMAANIAAGRQAELAAQKEEYRQQMQHEQARVDHIQDTALNYTTKVTQSTNAASSTASLDKKYYLPDFGQSYSRKEVETYIMQGVVRPDTEIDANGINGKVYEQEEFFSFCLEKYGIACPKCGKKYLSELGMCTECGYEE